MNFKTETYEAIKRSGHTREDVMFVGSSDGKYRMTMDEFDKVSNFSYDKGFGAQQIASDLIVYFKDGRYMSRSEYDGSEWWNYEMPLNYKETDKYIKFHNLCAEQCGEIGWCTVKELNSNIGRG